MRTKKWLAAAAAVIPVLAGCGVPIQSGSHLSPTWDMSRPSTFAWLDEADRTSGDTRLEGSLFFHDRLHEAVEWELSLRGIRYSDLNPELLVHHHLSLADHVWEREVTDDQGYQSVESDVYEGGTVVVHIVNAQTGEDVWVGWAQANIEAAFTSPEAMRRWVYDLVGQMFRDWPVPPRTR
jgi:hypothetical protein